jgi:hypothetical protein
MILAGRLASGATWPHRGFGPRNLPQDRAVVECSREAFLGVSRDRRRAWLYRGDFGSYGLAKTDPNPLLFKDTDVARSHVTVEGPPA